VDREFPVVAEFERELRLLAESVRVAVVGVDRVDGVDARRAGREQHALAPVEDLRPLVGPGGAQVRREVLAAERDGVGRPRVGDGLGVQHAAGGFDQRDHGGVGVVFVQ